MSDCRNGSRASYRWEDQAWHEPGERAHEVKVTLADGRKKYLHYWGPDAVSFEDGGVRYLRPPSRDWDAESVE